MKDYLFFSYSKTVKPMHFLKKRQRIQAKRLMQGFEILPAKNSIYNTDMFKKEFGPSFDCVGQLDSKTLFIGQFIRHDRNPQKTYAHLTIDKQANTFTYKYLDYQSPLEGRWFRNKQSNDDVYDVFVTNEKIVTRVNGKPEVYMMLELISVVAEFTPEEIDTENEITRNLETVECVAYNPRNIGFLNNHMLYISEDYSLCALNLKKKQVTILEVDVEFYLSSPGFFLVFQQDMISVIKDSTIKAIKQSKGLVGKARKLIKENKFGHVHWGENGLSAYGSKKVNPPPVNRLDDYFRYHENRQELLTIQKEREKHKLVDQSVSFVQRTATKGLTEDHIPSIIVLQDSLVIMTYFNEKTNANLIVYTQLLLGAASDDHRIWQLGNIELAHCNKTAPVILARPFSGVITSNDVRVCLLIEPRSLHLVYKYKHIIGCIFENRGICDSNDGEIYGMFVQDVHSLVVYGWDICKEIRICF